MRRTTRRWIAAALLVPCAAFSLSLAGAPAGRAAPGLHAAVSGGVVAADVAQGFATQDVVPVIVSLRVDTAPPGLDGSLDISTRRAEIETKADAIEAGVPDTQFRVARRYGAIPALAGVATAAGVGALAARPEVAHVALDREVHADLAQARVLVHADDVENVLGFTGDGVVVAVLDSGIDTDHPALSDDLVWQQCFLIDGGCPTTAGLFGGCPPNGATTSLFAEDGSSHGSHVSGIITSSGAPSFVHRGIAPDALVKAFKVLDDCGSGHFSDIIAVYDEIILSHTDVQLINMSLSDGGTYSPGTCEDLIPAMTDAINDTRTLGKTTFAAAGNNGSKAGIAYPACISGVVSVGAVYDANVGARNYSACSDAASAPDQITCFSQSDPSLDLLGPGAIIDSTVPFGGTAKSGTSMSSPAVAAVAALLLESEPALTPSEIEARLKGTGVPRYEAINGVTTCRVDAYEALLNDGGPVCQSSVKCLPTNVGPGAPSNVGDCDFEQAYPGLRGDGCVDDAAQDADPASPWDFYSVPLPALFSAAAPQTTFRDSEVTAQDAQATFAYASINANSGSAAYEQDANLNGIRDGWEYDRSGSAFSAGPPNGAITAQDAQAAFAQSGVNFSCASGYDMRQ